MPSASTYFFDMNSANNGNTGNTSAYLAYDRELRTLDDVQNGLRQVVEADNFIPQITPYLRRMATVWREARDIKRPKGIVIKNKPMRNFVRILSSKLD